MDISQIKPKIITHDVIHPGTGEPIGLSVQMRSVYSKEVKRTERQILDAKIERKGVTTAEESEADAIQFIAASVSDWEWKDDLNFHGNKPECNFKNVVAVLTELPWMKDQLDKVLYQTNKFFLA